MSAVQPEFRKSKRDSLINCDNTGLLQTTPTSLEISIQILNRTQSDYNYDISVINSTLWTNTVAGQCLTDSKHYALSQTIVNSIENYIHSNNKDRF